MRWEMIDSIIVFYAKSKKDAETARMLKTAAFSIILLPYC